LLYDWRQKIPSTALKDSVADVRERIAAAQADTGNLVIGDPANRFRLQRATSRRNLKQSIPFQQNDRDQLTPVVPSKAGGSFGHPLSI